jgi:hypothetical protein
MKRIKLILPFFALVTAACGSSPTTPSTPRPAATVTAGAPAVAGPAAPAIVSWSCLTTPGCTGARASASTRGVAGLSVPNAPSNLAASVSGATVTLTWRGPQITDGVTSSLVEAGSTSGTSNLASINVEHNLSLVATNVPVGTYYVRVRSQNSAGTSEASNEVVVIVGGASCTPAAPSGLTSSVSGSSVAFTWTAPGGTCTPTTYELDAGSSSGASNLAVVATGNTSTSFFASNVGAGTYYVRVRAANGANLSTASNEAVVTVGSTSSAGVTGRWVGLAPDGLVIDAATNSCEIESDVELNLSQTGSAVTGTITSRVRKLNPNRPGCGSHVGLVDGPSPISGTVGAGTVTMTMTADHAETSTLRGTFSATRMVLTLGTLTSGAAVMTLNRQ